MRRFDRLWKLLANGLFTLSGTYDVLRILYVRQERKDTFYRIHLPVGEVLVDGQNADVDFQVLGQVFLDEVYKGLQFRDRIVLDVGAHKGYFAAYALMSGAKAVLSFEPEKVNFTCLAQFAESARLRGRSIKVFQVAVTDSDGDVTLHLNRESWRHSIVQGQVESCGKNVRVPSRSLANILTNVVAESMGQDLIMKIDAEGVEGPLLLNTPADCFAYVKEIIFEFHSFGCCELRVILDRLQSLGLEYVAYERDVDLHHLRVNSTRAATLIRAPISD